MTLQSLKAQCTACHPPAYNPVLQTELLGVTFKALSLSPLPFPAPEPRHHRSQARPLHPLAPCLYTAPPAQPRCPWGPSRK